LFDVVLHPKYAQNHYIYLSYAKPNEDGKQGTTAVTRAKFENDKLSDIKEIFVADAWSDTPGHFGARMAFDKDGYLFLSVGDRMEGLRPEGMDPTKLATHHAQLLVNHQGKILRLKDDGTVPPDNPFVGQAGKRPEIYTLGHRGTLGLAMHPGTGDMWQNENGPNGGDEINILKPGRNYGWPIVSYGRDYPGPWHNEVPGHIGFEAPVVLWIPAIAVSGMTFYTGDKLPKWKGDVFVGSLRTGEIPGTGHVERILFNEKMQELRRESLLTELRQRVRDVRQGPDGFLYVLTDEKDGAVLRIEPAP
jgi:glucose/arabinose dehydrogenase